MYGHRNHALLGARRAAQQDTTGMHAAAARAERFPRMPSRYPMNYPMGRSQGRAPQSIANIAMPPPRPRFTHRDLPQRIPSPEESKPLPFAIAVIEQSRGGLAREGFSQKKQLPAIRPAQTPHDVTATRSICTKETKTRDNSLDSAVQQPPMVGEADVITEKNHSNTKTLNRQSTASDIREVIAGILSWESDRQRMMRGDREPQTVEASLATSNKNTLSDGPNQNVSPDVKRIKVIPTLCDTPHNGGPPNVKTDEARPTSCDASRHGAPTNTKTTDAKPTTCDAPCQGGPSNIKTVEARSTLYDAPRQAVPPYFKTVEVRPTSCDAPHQDGPHTGKTIKTGPSSRGAPHQGAPLDVKTGEARPTSCNGYRQGVPPNVRTVDARTASLDGPYQSATDNLKTTEARATAFDDTLQSVPQKAIIHEARTAFYDGHQSVPPNVKAVEAGAAILADPHQSVPPMVKAVEARTTSFDEPRDGVPHNVEKAETRAATPESPRNIVPPNVVTIEARVATFDDPNQSVPPTVKSVDAKTVMFDDQNAPPTIKTIEARAVSFDAPLQCVQANATTVESRAVSSDGHRQNVSRDVNTVESRAASFDGTRQFTTCDLKPVCESITTTTTTTTTTAAPPTIKTIEARAVSFDAPLQCVQANATTVESRAVSSDGHRQNVSRDVNTVESRAASFDGTRQFTTCDLKPSASRPPFGRENPLIEGVKTPRNMPLSPREDQLVKETMDLAMRGMQELIDMARSFSKDDDEDDDEDTDNDDVVMNCTEKSAKVSGRPTPPSKHGVSRLSSSSRCRTANHMTEPEQSSEQYDMPDSQSENQSLDYCEMPVPRSPKHNREARRRSSQNGTSKSQSTSRPSKSRASVNYQLERHTDNVEVEIPDDDDDDVVAKDIANIHIASRRSAPSSRQSGAARLLSSSRYKTASRTLVPQSRAQSSEQYGNLDPKSWNQSVSRSSKHDRVVRDGYSKMTESTSRSRVSNSRASTNRRRESYEDAVAHSAENEKEIADGGVPVKDIASIHRASRHSTSSSREHAKSHSLASSRCSTANHYSTPEQPQSTSQSSEQYDMPELQFSDHHEMPMSRSPKHERTAKRRSAQSDVPESRSTSRHRASKSRTSANHRQVRYADAVEYSTKNEAEMPDDVAANDIANIHIASRRSTLSSRHRGVVRSLTSSRYKPANHTPEPQSGIPSLGQYGMPDSQSENQSAEQNDISELQFSDGYEMPGTRSSRHDRMARRKSTQSDVPESRSIKVSKSRASANHRRVHYKDVVEYFDEKEVDITDDDVAANEIANIYIDPEPRRRSCKIRRALKGIRNMFRTCFICCGSQFCDR